MPSVKISAVLGTISDLMFHLFFGLLLYLFSLIVPKTALIFTLGIFLVLGKNGSAKGTINTKNMPSVKISAVLGTISENK
jgi:hypothetical protein